VVREPFNWQHLSGIGAVRCTGEGKKPRWFLSIRRGNIRAVHVARFLDSLRRHVRKKVILLMDRWAVHRSRIVARALERNRSWLTVEWLPSYAPEYNGTEYLWAYLDQTDLANTPAENLGRLRRQAMRGVGRLCRKVRTGEGVLGRCPLFGG